MGVENDFLKQDIMYLRGVGPKKKEILFEELGLHTVESLLEYYPFRWEDRTRIYHIKDIVENMPQVQFRGVIVSFEVAETRPFRKRVVAHFKDSTGLMDLVWFLRGSDWITKRYALQKPYIVYGKPAFYKGRAQMSHPEIMEEDKPKGYGGLMPVYHTTDKMKRMGLESRFIETLQRQVQDIMQERGIVIKETLPEWMIQKYRLMSRHEAIMSVHFAKDNDTLASARRRLKFEELLFLELRIVRHRHKQLERLRNGYRFTRVGRMPREYFRRMPFPLTEAQKRVIHEIKDDMFSGHQMNRLLQGDVGSGKTVVALYAAMMSWENGYQTVLIAPTEILARQHYETITKSLVMVTPGGAYDQIRLLTGAVKGLEREKTEIYVKMGICRLLIGTHALLEERVGVFNLGLVIIDEQHRFGVRQRAKLWEKANKEPHILVMSATPIPRTLALTAYGDLSVSVLDELPKGRKPVKTEHYTFQQEHIIFQEIERTVRRRERVYVVFPLIKESENSDLHALEMECEKFQGRFSEICKVRMLHGKMKTEEKQDIVDAFTHGDTGILLSTIVVEVGVNVPEATLMVIENAERFGLAQLHQLRGRVGRSDLESRCLLVTKSDLKEEALRRMEIMCQTTDGFRIAEEDMRLRGPGDLEGTEQSGFALDLKIANLATDGRMLEVAKKEADEAMQRLLKAEDRIRSFSPDIAQGEREDKQDTMLWQRLKETKDTTGWFGDVS